MRELRNLDGMDIQRAGREMRTLMEMRSEMENKGPLLSPPQPPEHSCLHGWAVFTDSL